MNYIRCWHYTNCCVRGITHCAANCQPSNVRSISYPYAVRPNKLPSHVLARLDNTSHRRYTMHFCGIVWFIFGTAFTACRTFCVLVVPSLTLNTQAATNKLLWVRSRFALFANSTTLGSKRSRSTENRIYGSRYTRTESFPKFQRLTKVRWRPI